MCVARLKSIPRDCIKRRHRLYILNSLISCRGSTIGCIVVIFLESALIFLFIMLRLDLKFDLIRLIIWIQCNKNNTYCILDKIVLTNPAIYRSISCQPYFKIIHVFRSSILIKNYILAVFIL